MRSTPSDPSDEGERLHGLAAELFPICRSITGEGVRETLRRLQARIGLQIRAIPTGTPVLDWTIPPEWNVREAWIEGPDGSRVVDFADHSLHLVSYSEPVDAELTFDELRPHLHTLPEQPELIPYRTSYWDRTWGFCLPHRRLNELPVEGTYRAFIDSSLEDGELTWGELVIDGKNDSEVLVSCHICHPSLCNDNLSGVVVAAALAEWLSQREALANTYRFLFIPGTIGSIAWLASSPNVIPKIRHGMVLAGVGDPGKLTWKRSRRGNHEMDRAVEHVLRHQASGAPQVQDFSPYGYDERQYGAPGFDLPVGCLMRTPWGKYPEYHTSADNMDFVTPGQLADTLTACRRIVDVLEGNGQYLNLSPKGEPQLGRRGLYEQLGGGTREGKTDLMSVLWVLNQSDGNNDLLAIADKASLQFASVRWAADRLLEAGLLAEVSS